MKKYKVYVHPNLDQILEDIRHRADPEYTKWTSKEFICYAAAKRYAFLATLSSGRSCSIKLIDLDPTKSLVERVNHVMGRLGAE